MFDDVSLGTDSVLGVLGLIGFLFYIGAYLALQIGLIRGQTYTYSILNLFASGLVLISLIEAFNMASALVNTAWVTISLIGIARLYIIHRTTRFDADEAAIVAALVPDLPKDRARAFMRLGAWETLEPGDVLTREGEPVDALTYIARGRVSVQQEGAHIVSVGRGGMIGEVTYLDGAPATATVVALSELEVYRFDAGKLRDALKRHHDIRAELEQTLARTLRERITRSTGQVSRMRRVLHRIEAVADEPRPSR